MTKPSTRFKERLQTVRDAVEQTDAKPPSFLLNKLPAQQASNDEDVKETVAWYNQHPWSNVHPWRN